jgi:hypothetical protein
MRTVVSAGSSSLEVPPAEAEQSDTIGAKLTSVYDVLMPFKNGNDFTCLNPQHDAVIFRRQKPQCFIRTMATLSTNGSVLFRRYIGAVMKSQNNDHT